VGGSGGFTLTQSITTCGDGKVEAGEACDDGNTKPGDCCSATCQKEVTRPCGLGGDGGADASASDASRPDAAADASRSKEGGSGGIDGVGADLVAIDPTEGTVGGGGMDCNCETPRTCSRNGERTSMILGALLLALRWRRRRTREKDARSDTTLLS